MNYLYDNRYRRRPAAFDAPVQNSDGLITYVRERERIKARVGNKLLSASQSPDESDSSKIT